MGLNKKRPQTLKHALYEFQGLSLWGWPHNVKKNPQSVKKTCHGPHNVALVRTEGRKDGRTEGRTEGRTDGAQIKVPLPTSSAGDKKASVVPCCVMLGEAAVL
jgi:hypothetical protein